MWLCSQLGAREHYAIPRALFRKGSLDHLLTDAWAPPASILRIVGERRSEIRDRWHEELKEAPVTSFNWSLIAFEIMARARRLRGWPLIVARNHWFQQKVVAYLSDYEPGTNNREPTLFSYSYSALEPFRFAKSRGWRTVLGQIDPGPVEEEIVAGEVEREPSFAPNWKHAPTDYWKLWREECELADLIVANSEWSRSCLVEAGVNSSKLFVIPLAYESPRTVRRVTREYPARFTLDRPLRVLFLGQINLRKGVARLLEAAQALQNEPLAFWMVGPRQCQPSEQLRRLKNVRWFGRLAHSDAAKYYREADVFILPTLSDGFALTQLEAQAQGLPVIASRRCGEVVRDRNNGIVLDEPTPEAIAAALQSCLRNPDRLASFSAASCLEHRFSIEALSQNLLSILTY